MAVSDAACRLAELLLPKILLKANARHVFRDQLQSVGPVTHVRLNIYPDGGISRFRVFGVAGAPLPSGRGLAPPRGIERFNELVPAQATKALLDCCGSQAWVAAMMARRPYSSANDFFVAADAIWGRGSRGAIGSKRFAIILHRRGQAADSNPPEAKGRRRAIRRAACLR